jgi:hypothetical protein
MKTRVSYKQRAYSDVLSQDKNDTVLKKCQSNNGTRTVVGLFVRYPTYRPGFQGLLGLDQAAGS